MTSDQILRSLLDVDGVDSRLDADTLDGLSSASFLRTDQNGSIGGTLSAGGLETAQGLIVAGALIIDGAGNWLGAQPMSNTQIRDALVQVDGAGSGVDADTIDGLPSEAFLRNDEDGAIAGLFVVDELDSGRGLSVAGELIIDERGQWLGPQPMSNIQIRDALIQVDGAGSGVDADTLDGLSSASFLRNDQNGSIGGILSAGGLETAQGLIVAGALIIDGAGNWLGAQPMSNTQIRDALVQVDGAGSGVDADTLDGLSSASFLRSDQNGSIGGILSAGGLETAQGLIVAGELIIDERGQWLGPQPMSNIQIRDALIQVDGAGSGVDADTLDGLSSASFLRNDQNGSIGGILSASGLETAQGLIVSGALIIDGAGNWLGAQPMSNAQIRDALVQVDGAGGGVDADTLDGLSSTSFLRNDQNGSIGGVLSASGLETAQGLIVAGELIIDERGNWLGPQPMSNIQIRDALTQVDGAGSGVDADTLDGLSSTSFLRNDQNGSVGGVLSASGLETAQGLIVAGELIIDDRGQWLGPPANEQYPNQRCLDSSGWRRQRRGRRHAGRAVKLVIYQKRPKWEYYRLTFRRRSRLIASG